MNETDEVDSNSQGEDGQHVTPETYPHRVLFMGLMNEVLMSSKEPNGGGKALCSARRGKKCSLLRAVKAGYFMYIGRGSSNNDDVSYQFSQRHLYCFSECVIVFKRLMRSTVKVKEILLQLFLFQESQRTSIYLDITESTRQLSKGRTKRQTKNFIDCVNLQITKKS